MIRRYGNDAVIQAAMRGDALLAKGDLERLLVWLAIIRAIERLQASEPGASEATH